MKAGSLIKLLRTAEGVSQTSLAADLGVARTYLSQVENNKVKPGLGLLKAASEKFAIPLSLLVIDYSNEEGEIFQELQRLLCAVLSSRIALGKDCK